MLRLLKRAAALAAALIVLGGAYAYWSFQHRLVQVGDVRIDPRASIDPERSYTLILWEREIPLPWEAGAHAKAVEDAVAEFRRTWPNIEVELVFLEWDEGDGRLREAIASGTPPDVYSMPLGTRLFDPAWQIPVDRYLSAEARDDTLPKSLEAVTSGGRVWGWPRWVLPLVWIAREDLAESLGERRAAWSGEELLGALASAQADGRSLGIALNPYDGRLFFDVMVASTGRNPLDEAGRRAWTVEEMEEALKLFSTIIERGLTGADPQRMSRTRLASFSNGQASVAAPVSPWLLQHFQGRVAPGEEGNTAGAERRRGFAVPPPSVGSGRGIPAVVGGYVVFRREPYPGDDHTKAAMLLAEHLSRRLGPWEAAHLVAVPAHLTSWESWRSDTGLPDRELDLFVAWAERAIAPPLADAHASRQARLVNQVLGESFVKLWRKVPPREIAEEMALSIDGVRAERANP